MVLHVSRNWRGKYLVKLAHITRRELNDSVPQVLLAGGENSWKPEVATVSGGGWFQGTVWCYACKPAIALVCDPDQTQVVPVHWKVTENSLNTLSHLDARLKANGEFSKSEERVNDARN